MAFSLKFRDPAPPVSVDAWRDRTRKAPPQLAWAYVDGGVDDHVMLDENVAAKGI